MDRMVAIPSGSAIVHSMPSPLDNRSVAMVPGLLQDDHAGLSKWFATRMDAGFVVRMVAIPSGSAIVHPSNQETAKETP
jgi:hypothetical protein